MSQFSSLIVFIATMIWTWSLFNSSPSIGIATHAGIQSKFMSLIENSVRKSAPGITDFEIISLHTKNVDDRQVSAHFSYRFNEQIGEEERTAQVFSGEALLTRTLSENPDDDRWLVQSIQAHGQSIEFQQGLTVDPQTAPSDKNDTSNE